MSASEDSIRHLPPIEAEIKAAADPVRAAIEAGIVYLPPTQAETEAKIEPDAGGRRSPRVPKHRKIVDSLAIVELWHDPSDVAYATIDCGDHVDDLPLRSRAFALYMGRQYWNGCQLALSDQDIKETIATLEGHALYDGACHAVHLRVAEHGGDVWYDLCSPDRRFVKIGAAAGVTVVDSRSCPVKWRRNSAMRPAAIPMVCEEPIAELLAPFFGFANDSADMTLTVCWIAMALTPRGPHPVLAISGLAGSGKSTRTRWIREMIDPNLVPHRSSPERPEDFAVALHNNWALCFDNLSGMSRQISDMFCRASTGAGYAKRQHYSDAEENYFQARRPIVLNGISDQASAPDLADRAIAITLPAISDETRRPESELEAAFAAALPKIMFALFTGVSAALRNLPTTQLDRLPRMADFARFAVAAAPGLGFSAADVLGAYESNRTASAVVSLDASAVAQAIMRLVDADGTWIGRATELLGQLEGYASQSSRNARNWPRTPSSMGAELRRLTPALGAAGYVVEHMLIGHKKDRVTKLSKRGDSGATP